jgi:predicted  nucleic acid-binding Zn-ribbon protein
MEAVKTNKITTEELEAVVKNQNAQQAYLSNIGSLEFQKSVLSAELSGLVQESEKLKKSLEEAYGQVQIDLKTGEYTEVEKE